MCQIEASKFSPIFMQTAIIILNPWDWIGWGGGWMPPGRNLKRKFELHNLLIHRKLNKKGKQHIQLNGKWWLIFSTEL